MSKRLTIAVAPFRRVGRGGLRHRIRESYLLCWAGALVWVGASGCSRPDDASSGAASAADDDAAQGAASAAVNPQREWWRGGPSPHPAQATGPIERPGLVWSVPLQGVISARAAIGPGGKSEWIAYAGTHGGRVAGVVVDGENAGTLVMDTQLGGIIWASPVIDLAGNLLVGADDDRLTAIAPRDGRILWSLRLGDCTPARALGPEGTRCDVDGGPTIGPSGDIYVGGAGLHRITPSGQVRWSFPAPPEVAPHVFATPAVTGDGHVYFGAQDGAFYAVDDTGRLAWHVALGPDVDGSPAVGPDGTVYVGADDGAVRAFAPGGRAQWTVKTGKDIRAAIAVGRNGAIYAASLDGSLYALHPDGAVHWVFPTGGPIFSSPVVDRAGNLFVGSTDHWLYALAPDGTLLWRYEMPADVDASVAIAPSGHLVVGCDDGILRALL